MRECINGKVSIIIGLYNVAHYLNAKQLSCILNQTYRNIEVILVNDGSTDETETICQQLSEKDSRIVLVYKPNGGLGSARNAGLNVATGDYVWFYDVDDEVELNLVEKNVKWMSEYCTDMIIFGAWFVYPHQQLIQTSCFKEKIVESNADFRRIFLDEIFFVPNGNGFVWNKFYRKSFIEEYGMRFGNQRIQQDELFNLQLYPHVERIYISSELLYHYYIYKSGNNRSHYIPDRIQIYESIFDSMSQLAGDWDISDSKWTDNMFHRLYSGISICILYNAFHPEVKHTIRQKKDEITRILQREKVKLCLGYIDKKSFSSLESKLYFNSFLKNSFWQICFWRVFFISIRAIKRWFIG